MTEDYYLEVFAFSIRGPKQIGHVEIKSYMTPEQVGYKVNNLIDRRKQVLKLATEYVHGGLGI